MSLATIDNVHQRIKRKLDDYGGPDDDDDDFSSDLIAVRMRKDDIKAAVNSSIPIITPSPSPPSEPQTPSPPPQPHFQQQKQQQSRPHTRAAAVFSYVTGLQFFVRMISGYKTLVVHSNPEDTVKSVHEKIYSITGIPVNEQRLIYRGKQLQWGQTLAECSVQNDASLQLVGRMLSTEHPLAWHIMDEIVLLVCRMCKGEARNGLKHVKDRITEFFKSAPKMDTEVAAGHIQVFSSSCAPAALVMLYLSPHKFNKGFGEELIRHFISSSREQLDKAALSQCAPILLEFCKLLRRVAHDDPLYSLCRSSLGSTVEYVGIERGLRDYDRNYKGGITVQEIFPFVRELAVGLSEGLVSSMECVSSSVLLVSNVRDFVAFLTVLRAAVAEVEDFSGPISVPFEDYYRRYREEVPFLHGIFIDFMVKMETCLGKMERGLVVKERREGGWDQYLDILKELHSISKLYEGAEKEFWTKMAQKKVSFCYLIVRYAKRDEDHRWILEHKDVINFESRRHLAMMWLPEVRDEYEDLHEMLIDRSQLLAESYEYIARAEPITLRAGLFMEFKNEEATGPGVLREWFFLVCQAIFNPQNALFVACPNDRRRFYPNPASTVDPLHLEYFKFSGRIIALALMHKIQVGIVFDRIFFLQLAGDNVSLEDVRDADPYLYSSCKQILSMDPCTVDQDALGLTFVREVEELGARKTVELCPDGRSIIVNSQNRKKYVDLLIEHRFVTSIADQVQKFSEGFADIIQGIPAASEIRKLFFRSLELEDLDWMLHGSESPISVEDWKAHTEYNGYKDTDPQIAWFWKVLDEMTPEQRKVLLFFWTSIKYLPVEGFRGLASRLYIYKSPEPLDRLPSSHTCFYRLCFPPYPSKSAMRKRLSIITQEHVGCSFGTW